MVTERAILYAFWVSSSSWRVRAALHWKNIDYEERAVDIFRRKEQLTAKYAAISPAQKVPALVIDGVTLVESVAIMQYLEATRPDPTLLPATEIQRARMWAIVETIASGIQPLQNAALAPFFSSEEQYMKFATHFTDRGLQTLEAMVSSTSGKYCVGDQLTMADLCLVPQMNNASTKAIDFSKYPITMRLYNDLLKEQVIQESHPRNIRHKQVKVSFDD